MSNTELPKELVSSKLSPWTIAFLEIVPGDSLREKIEFLCDLHLESQAADAFLPEIWESLDHAGRCRAYLKLIHARAGLPGYTVMRDRATLAGAFCVEADADPEVIREREKAALEAWQAQPVKIRSIRGPEDSVAHPRDLPKPTPESAGRQFHPGQPLTREQRLAQKEQCRARARATRGKAK